MDNDSSILVRLYQDYLNKFEMQDSDDAIKSFKTRYTFARILPAEFNLNEIFDKIQPNNLEESGESGEEYNSDLDKDILECN